MSILLLMCITLFIFASTIPFLINRVREEVQSRKSIRPMTTTPEAYVHLSADETTLTFYYDILRAERDGTTWGIGETREYNDYLIPLGLALLELSIPLFSLLCLTPLSVISAPPLHPIGSTDSSHLKASKDWNTSTPCE